MVFAALFTTSQQTEGSLYGLLVDLRELKSSTGGTECWSLICRPTAGGNSAGMVDS
jgi:hypothetical protein